MLHLLSSVYVYNVLYSLRSLVNYDYVINKICIYFVYFVYLLHIVCHLVLNKYNCIVSLILSYIKVKGKSISPRKKKSENSTMQIDTKIRLFLVYFILTRIV